MEKRRALLAVMASGILARAALLLWGPREWLAKPWEYEWLAQNLFHGQGFQTTFLGTTYHAFVHPFYPWFCAGVYGLAGEPSIPALQWVQAALTPLAAWLAFQIGRELGSEGAGVLAAAGVVLHPGLIIYSLRPHPLWLDSLCFLTIVWCTLSAARSAWPKEAWPRVIALGAALGWGFLSRSTVAAAVPLIGVWLTIRWRGQGRRAARLAAIAAVAAAMALPWILRNWAAVGRPVGMLSSSAYSLWVGNHPGATGSALDDEGRPVLKGMPAEFIREVYRRDEKGQIDFFYREALSFMKENPGRAAGGFLAKWLQFWGEGPRTGAWYPGLWTRVYRIYYALLLIVAAAGAGALLRRGQGPGLLFLALFALAISAIQSLAFVEGRHRWEVEPLLVVAASFGLVQALDWLRRQPHARPHPL